MDKRIRSTTVPGMTKLACFFLALGVQQQSNVDTNPNTCVSQGTASKIVAECLDVIKTKVPNIIGCVYCTHIPIKRPALEEKYLYQNESGYFNLNTLMICDENLVVRYVDARNPGENGDNFVWQQSDAMAYFKAIYDAGLIGDCAFPLQPYLMTPCRQPRERYEIIYNEKLVKAHKLIHDCFNAIKNRFCCMAADEAIHYLPEKATKIVNACCAIHNACIFHKDNSEFDDINATKTNDTNCNRGSEFNNEEEDNCTKSTEFNSEADVSEEALKIRKNLAECLQIPKHVHKK